MINTVTSFGIGGEIARHADEWHATNLKNISAARTSVCRNGARGFSTRSAAVEAARVKLGREAKTGVHFLLIADTPEPGRWSWELLKIQRRLDGLRVGSNEAKMVDLALRPEGVTRAELREALGWRCDPYPSLLTACDKAAVVLSVQRHGEGPFRYRGRRL